MFDELVKQIQQLTFEHQKKMMESQLQEQQAKTRKAELEAQVAELVLEAVRKTLNEGNLPSFNVGGGFLA